MKKLYLIGGCMGVGKTTLCQQLKHQLNHSVFLDGDWCWDAEPFQVTDETKQMVLENICFLLNQFIHCSAYENILFCWVMHDQAIIDTILSHIDQTECRVYTLSLVCDEATLKARLQKDIDAGLRNPDIICRSVARIPLYWGLKSIKIDTTGKKAAQICAEILHLCP